MNEVKVLTVDSIEEIKKLFTSVFTKEPWNDDWSDEAQLDNYIRGIIGNSNSLALGLYCDTILSGLALGSIIHWYRGTEYYIREFCVLAQVQGKGLGSQFLSMIQDHLIQSDIHTILLSTELGAPAYRFYKKNNFKELEQERFFCKNF